MAERSVVQVNKDFSVHVEHLTRVEGHGNIVLDVKNGKITNVTVIDNQGHQTGGCLVPVHVLSNHKVNALVVSGIGLRPLAAFNEVGIDVYHDATLPDIKPVVESLITGNLSIISRDQTCSGSGECHS